MDSKSIYIASNTYLRMVSWEKYGEEEWIYIGVGKDFELDKASRLVKSTLKTEKIYIVTDRKNSRVLLVEDISKGIEMELNAGSFVLWDSSFRRVVEFNRIGVARKGYRV